MGGVEILDTKFVLFWRHSVTIHFFIFLFTYLVSRHVKVKGGVCRPASDHQVTTIHFLTGEPSGRKHQRSNRYSTFYSVFTNGRNLVTTLETSLRPTPDSQRGEG